MIRAFLVVAAVAAAIAYFSGEIEIAIGILGAAIPISILWYCIWFVWTAGRALSKIANRPDLIRKEPSPPRFNRSTEKDQP